MCDAAQFYWG